MVPTFNFLNVGTVPMFSILNVGTVPTFNILNVGTVPTFKGPLKIYTYRLINCLLSDWYCGWLLGALVRMRAVEQQPHVQTASRSQIV